MSWVVWILFGWSIAITGRGLYDQVRLTILQTELELALARNAELARIVANKQRHIDRLTLWPSRVSKLKGVDHV